MPFEADFIMKNYLYTAFLSFALLNTAVVAADSVFVEQNGRLIVEIESVAAVSDWHETVEFPGFTGSAAYLWDRSGTTSAGRADAGAITYHFTINTPGNYEFRWRSRIGEGTSGTEANDSWVRFPTGSNVDEEHPLNGWTKGFMNQRNAWSWRTVTVDFVGEPIRQHFTAGDHTLQISGRSKGHVIDRFALYKYDQVNFNDGVFTNAPQSPHTGDDLNVVSVMPEPEPEPQPAPEPQPEPQPEPEPEPEPEPQPEPQPEPDSTQNVPADNANEETVATDVPAVQPWQIPANLSEAGECSDGVISLSPLNAININNNQIGDSGDLLVDGGQSALLKFDLSAVPATATSAALTMNVGADSGEGALLISAGSHSDWDDTDASLLPDVSHFIGSFSGAWSEGTRYGFSFDHTLIASDSATLVLAMEQGANGISVVSVGSNDEPRLQLAGPDTFCADYDANLAALATLDAELKAEVTSEVETRSDGGGSLQLLELLLLTLSLTAVGKYFRRPV